MRELTFKMPKVLNDGYKYMMKMCEMLRLEDCDVENEALYSFDMPDFHRDKEQKKVPPERQDTWVCSIHTNFKYALDHNCRQIERALLKFFRLGIIAEREIVEETSISDKAITSSR
jgi:hypothetical protein